MWQAIVVVFAVLGLLAAVTLSFRMGLRTGETSSSSTMTAAKMLWDTASKILEDQSRQHAFLESLQRRLSEIEEHAKAMALASSRSAIEAKSLTTAVTELDTRTGMVFEALNGGVVLKRGQLQEQVAMGMELRRAEELKVSRGLDSSPSATPF